MRLFVRLLTVLRKGAPAQRLQALGGILLVLCATFFAVRLLWPILVIVGLFVGGFWLISRAFRRSQPSS